MTGLLQFRNPTGGYGTYEYSIDAGGSWQLAGTYTNLQPATYDVRIRDAAHPGCVIILNPGLVITEPAALSAAATGTNVTCFGANDGTISVTGAQVATVRINIHHQWRNDLVWSSAIFTNLRPAPMMSGYGTPQIRPASYINPQLVITEPADLNATVAKQISPASVREMER